MKKFGFEFMRLLFKGDKVDIESVKKGRYLYEKQSFYKESDPGMEKRSYAQIGETRLCFFKEYLCEKEIPEEYR